VHRNNQVVNVVTFIGIIKVFIASFMVFVFNPFYFDIFSLMGHVGLLIEAFLILPYLTPSSQNIVVSTGIQSIDWFFDFFNPLSEYPTLFLYNEPNHPTAAFFPELFVIITLTSILTIMFIIIFTKYTLELTSKTRETMKAD
jgi:hypothetical protein